MRVDTMVVLKEYDVLSKAEKAKALLDDVGMWSMVNNEYMSTSHATEPTHAQLITRKVDVARALEIIAAYEQESNDQFRGEEILVHEGDRQEEYIIF